MAEIDRISICSEALVLIGEAPIDTFEGSSVPQLVAQQRYGSVVRMLLSEHPWDFNRRVATLAVDADATVTAQALGYDYGFVLPTDCWWFAVPLVHGCETDDWEIAEGRLYLPAGPSDVVIAKYHGTVDEALWPPKFRELVVYMLASEFAIPMAEDMQKADGMRTLAERFRREAKHQNANRSPAKPIRTGRLTMRKVQ